MTPLPTLATLFAVIAVISFLQIPASVVISQYLFAGIVLNQVFIAGIPVFVAWRQKIRLRSLFSFQRPRLTALFFGLLFIIGADLLIDYATAATEIFLPLPSTYQEQFDKVIEALTFSQVLQKFFLICLLPGVCEEIFFRGFCQTGFARHWGEKRALLATALLFALIHGNPWYLHLYFLLGFFLSLIYALTKNLWLPIFCHVLNNTWTFFNHQQGITFPLKGFFSVLDLSLFLLGILLLIFAVAFLRKTRVNVPNRLPPLKIRGGGRGYDIL